MRIHVLSDLHLEFSPFIAPQVTASDVVILAGDIHVKGHGVPWARPAFEGPVLYVPGNHEFYGGHSHCAVDYKIAGTRVVCNPRGYPGEETGFDPALVLTL